MIMFPLELATKLHHAEIGRPIFIIVTPKEGMIGKDGHGRISAPFHGKVPIRKS